LGDLARVELTIRGRVQGVGFRWHAADTARRLCLRGWVRNEPAGDVFIVAQGEREALESLVAWCHIGPPSSRVDAVLIHWVTPAEDLGSGFRIRSG
jgi:acylphosphatase